MTQLADGLGKQIARVVTQREKRQPRDGDGDGRVCDGTPREREAPRESPQPLRKRGADRWGDGLHDELGQTIAKVLAVREKQAAADSSPVIPLMAPVLYPTLGALMAPEGQRMTGARHGLFAGLGLTGGWLGGHLLNDYLAEKGLMSNRGLAANLMSIVPAMGLGLGGAYLSSLLGDFQPPKRHGEENREENREEKPHQPRQKQAANPLVMGNPAVDTAPRLTPPGGPPAFNPRYIPAEELRHKNIDPWSPLAGATVADSGRLSSALKRLNEQGTPQNIGDLAGSISPIVNRILTRFGQPPADWLEPPGAPGKWGWIKQEPPPAGSLGPQGLLQRLRNLPPGRPLGPVPGGAPAPAFNPKDGPAPAFPPPGAPAPAFNP